MLAYFTDHIPYLSFEFVLEYDKIRLLQRSKHTLEVLKKHTVFLPFVPAGILEAPEHPVQIGVGSLFTH